MELRQLEMEKTFIILNIYHVFLYILPVWGELCHQKQNSEIFWAVEKIGSGGEESW